MGIHRSPSATDPSHPSPAFLTSSDLTFPPESSPNTLQTTSTPEPRPSSSSSRTRFHKNNDNDRDSATLIEEIIRRSGEVEEDAEREVERYGADDPRDPEEEKWNVYKNRNGDARQTETRDSVEEEQTECGPGWEEEKERDQNLVGWDGPDDPENPQNWSKTYKCFVTGICAIITFNVYVPVSIFPRFVGLILMCVVEKDFCIVGTVHGCEFHCGRVQFLRRSLLPRNIGLSAVRVFCYPCIPLLTYLL